MVWRWHFPNSPGDINFAIAPQVKVQRVKVQRAMIARQAAIVAALLAAAMFAAVASGQPVIVTQKGRAFHPGQLVVNAGDTVEIVNDDGELIHHAYVASDAFSFDSGDQEPGSKTDVVFSVAGHFTVLCGIHPKMRLDVEVK